MGDTQQPQPAGTGATGAEAAAELAEIQRRQEQVIKAALVPVWYWWAMAAAIVAIRRRQGQPEPGRAGHRDPARRARHGGG